MCTAGSVVVTGPAVCPRVIPPPSMTPSPRVPRRFKGKRVYPSVPNQPSEAGAHFMFELAKSVLAKAGGNSSTSLFTQVGGGVGDVTSFSSVMS